MNSICEKPTTANRLLCFYVLKADGTKRAGNTAMNLATTFRWVTAAQPAALLSQALLAGLALSGSTTALDAHMAVGAAAVILSVVQATLAFLWIRAGAPGWPLAVSLGSLAAEILQMASGRLQLFVLHLPLGVALFGSALALAIYVYRWLPGQTVPPVAHRVDSLKARPAEEKA
jgi:hypothetical protein